MEIEQGYFADAHSFYDFAKKSEKAVQLSPILCLVDKNTAPSIPK